MLRCVMVVYNDMPLLQRCVESVSGLVDEIVAVDGRYIDYPAGSMTSTDGTMEYLATLTNVRLISAPNLTEVEKRNRYLVGEPGDWYLHLDADEEWVGEPPPLEGGVDAYVLDFHREYPVSPMDRVRVFRHVEGLHYAKKHYWLHDAAGETFALLQKVGRKYNGEKFDGGHITHHEMQRPKERQNEKKMYYRILTARETSIRERL